MALILQGAGGVPAESFSEEIHWWGAACKKHEFLQLSKVCGDYCHNGVEWKSRFGNDFDGFGVRYVVGLFAMRLE